MSRWLRIALKATVWVACLAPLAFLLYHFWTDNLGANPIDEVTRTLGVRFPSNTSARKRSLRRPAAATASRPGWRHYWPTS